MMMVALSIFHNEYHWRQVLSSSSSESLDSSESPQVSHLSLANDAISEKQYRHYIRTHCNRIFPRPSVSKLLENADNYLNLRLTNQDPRRQNCSSSRTRSKKQKRSPERQQTQRDSKTYWQLTQDH
jgi:hypothetical protein